MISIALPIHGMDKAEFFLRRCLESIEYQTIQPFEVVITDNSDDDTLEKIIRTYALPIVYSKNPRKGMAQNTNEAIKRSSGRLVKILYMDDYLAHNEALQDIEEAFNRDGRGWLITASDNNADPHYTDNIVDGNNRLGSPSCLTIVNIDPEYFDEEMTWLLDCDYYKRLHDIYGYPLIVKRPGVVMGIGDHQITNQLTDGEKEVEHLYMKHKYEKD